MAMQRVESKAATMPQNAIESNERNACKNSIEWDDRSRRCGEAAAGEASAVD